MEHGGAVARRGTRELPRKPRLAAARLAADQRHPPALGARIAPQLAQQRELRTATDERERGSQAQRARQWQGVRGLGHGQS
jgi:hypothetical protein